MVWCGVGFFFCCLINFTLSEMFFISFKINFYVLVEIGLYFWYWYFIVLATTWWFTVTKELHFFVIFFYHLCLVMNFRVVQSAQHVDV
jgi:hypothetical protein